MLLTYTEHGPMVFQNRELRKIFGPKRDEETGLWRRLRKYYSADQNKE
jgi:hypothetical protein